MKRTLPSLFLTAILVLPAAVPARAASLDDIDRKLDKVIENQERILQELEVVKVRASR